MVLIRLFQYSCAYPCVGYIYMQLSCEVTLVKVHRIGISIGKGRYGRFLDFYGNGRHVPYVCAFVAWFHYSISPSLNSFARVKLANAGCQDWWYVCRWTRRTQSWERGIFIASTECRIERSTIHSDIKSSIRSDMRIACNSATAFVALAMRMPTSLRTYYIFHFDPGSPPGPISRRTRFPRQTRFPDKPGSPTARVAGEAGWDGTPGEVRHGGPTLRLENWRNASMPCRTFHSYTFAICIITKMYRTLF